MIHCANCGEDATKRDEKRRRKDTKRNDPYRFTTASLHLFLEGAVTMKKAKTHFPQVPVETVKKIAAIEPTIGTYMKCRPSTMP
jgi:hypothetical protein